MSGCCHMIPLQKNRTEEGEAPCPILALLPHISTHNDTWSQEPDLSSPMHTSPWDVLGSCSQREDSEHPGPLHREEAVSLNLYSAALGQ